MPPKDLVKSIQAYARFLDQDLEWIDDVLARVPAEGATPRSVLDDLEKVKASAEAKFDKMKMNYEIQSVSDELTEDMETAHTKVYDEAKARYKKAMVAANTVLEKLEVIDADFPNAKVRNVQTLGSLQEPAKEVVGSLPMNAKEVLGSLPKVAKGVPGSLPEPFPSTGSLPEVTK